MKPTPLFISHTDATRQEAVAAFAGGKPFVLNDDGSYSIEGDPKIYRISLCIVPAGWAWFVYEDCP